MGSLSLRKYVSHDHGKGSRACQLGIHQGIRAVLASRHAGCGGAVHGGARTFHGLYIAYAARVDRRLVPETQLSTKPAPGSPNTCPGVQYCPRGRWQWWGVHAATAAIVAAFLATTRARRPTLDPWHTPGIHPCAINHAASSCRGRAAQQQRNATDLARCKVQEPALICA